MTTNARTVDHNPLKGLGWISRSESSTPTPTVGEKKNARPDAQTSEVRKFGSPAESPEAVKGVGEEKRKADEGKKLHQAATGGREWCPRFEPHELTVPFHAHQVERLEVMVRSIMKGRGPEARDERITKNTVLRAWVEMLRVVEADLSSVRDEADLVERFRAAFARPRA